jgi:hypothetical protein
MEVRGGGEAQGVADQKNVPSIKIASVTHRETRKALKKAPTILWLGFKNFLLAGKAA